MHFPTLTIVFSLKLPHSNMRCHFPMPMQYSRGIQISDEFFFVNNLLKMSIDNGFKWKMHIGSTT